MYTLDGVSSVESFIIAYEESQYWLIVLGV